MSEPLFPPVVLIAVQLGAGLGGGAVLPAVGAGPCLRAQSYSREGAKGAKVFLQDQFILPSGIDLDTEGEVEGRKVLRFWLFYW